MRINYLAPGENLNQSDRALVRFPNSSINSLVVCKVMKGIYNLKPPKKKLILIWLMRTVLAFFKESWGDVRSLLLEELTIKMTMLIGLAMAKRPSSMALMTVLPDHYR